jgi:hypothetical protein
MEEEKQEMETIVYRTREDNPRTRPVGSDNSTVSHHTSGAPGSAQCLTSLSPELFYPVVSEQEMTMWTHWLPTAITFEATAAPFPSDIINRLSELHAPAPVLEEFRWACHMGLFEAYEVRTPERVDLRDPLLLGRLDGQYYRIALWGESLRSLGEIADLVRQSLAIRRRFAWRQKGIVASGMLAGLGLWWWLNTQTAQGLWLWLNSQASTEADRAVLGFLLAAICFCFGWLPFLYTPEHRQQDFLDRYRQ